MAMIREGNTFTANIGGTALWYLEPSRVRSKINAEQPTTKDWSGDLVQTSEPVVFFNITPSVRTSPPPNHPLWDRVEALIAEAQKGYIPTVEEDDAWLDSLRSNLGRGLEIFDDESD